MGVQGVQDWKRWLHDFVMLDDDSLGPYRDRIMQSMGVATLVLLTPFTINNIVQGRYLVALGIVLIQMATAANGYAAARGRPSPVPPILLLLIVVAALTAVSIQQGIIGAMWTYPLMVFTYFVLERRAAFVFSLMLLIYFPGLTWLYIDAELASRHLVSLLLIIVLITIVLNVISGLHRTLARQALTDPLTGCSNRRCMDRDLSMPVNMGRRHAVTASVLLMDVDHFKEINDTYGHGQGDLVLQQIVEIAGARFRSSDRLYRYGGEEFLTLLEQTDTGGALAVAEDIRARIEGADLLPDRRVTVSIGVAQYQAGQSVEAWTKCADSALYQAKAAGRNRVMHADWAGAADDAAEVSGPQENRAASSA